MKKPKKRIVGYETSLLTTTFMLSLLVVSNIGIIANPSYPPVLNMCQANDEVEQLLAVIRNEKNLKRNPEQIKRAIDRLGELKAKSAIDDLIRLITFQYRFATESSDTMIINDIHLVTPAGRYPAVGALFQIGEEALPALVQTIASNESNSLASENATFTIKIISRDDPKEGAEYVKRSASTMSGIQKERLLIAAEKVGSGS